MTFTNGGGFVQAAPAVTTLQTLNATTVNASTVNAQTLNVSGTATAPLLSVLYARDTGAHGALASASFVTVGSALITFTLPASGFLQIHHKTRITTGVAAQTYSADVIVKNTTAVTTPYAGSFNNCFNFSGVTSASGFDICGFLVVGPGGQGGTLGATGDTITVQVAYAVTGGTWAIGDTAVMVIPSL